MLPYWKSSIALEFKSAVNEKSQQGPLECKLCRNKGRPPLRYLRWANTPWGESPIGACPALGSEAVGPMR